MSSFDMDKLMQQAAQMQEQVARMQQEAQRRPRSRRSAAASSR